MADRGASARLSGTGDREAGNLFIVDNSDEHWKVLEYVRQWCEISRAIDIATGHFEIGAFLALDGEWQKVEKIRLLIGGETSRQTAHAIRTALLELDESVTQERERDPFLDGIEAVVAAVKTGQIEIKVYREKKFHAKAYITHGKLDVVGSAALVGSSNFTRPGLTRNVELNVHFTGIEAEELQAWYEAHWAEGEPVREELLNVLERQTHEHTPFEIYARALQILAAGTEQGATEWEQSESRMYPILAPYQQQAYHGLKQRARQWSGGFLTDGVGLGKTFVGLMLAEYYAVKERRNVLILATKTGRDAVWAPELERYLPELMGEFSNVTLLAHTDLSRQDADDRAARLAKRADVIIVDEAHNFRNRGTKGSEESGKSRSRWWRLQEIANGKLVFLLTATPINNRLFDFVHQAELFTGMADGYFQSIGISSVQAYVAKLERAVRDASPNGGPEGEVDLTEFEHLMHEDKLLESLVIQNSRKYGIESAKRADGDTVAFAKQDVPRAVPYSLSSEHGKMLEELDRAFQGENPLFVLPMYYPLAYWLGAEMDADERRRENRQKQVVGLIRTVFLKRFESSVAAFAGSCLDLTDKIVEWLLVNVAEFPEYAERLQRWRNLNADLLARVRTDFRPATLDEAEEEDASDLTLEELQEMEHFLEPSEYDLPAMLDAAFEDLVQLQRLLERVAQVGPKGDDKVRRLLELLHTGESKDDVVLPAAFRTDKVLVFTEFADTARYLHDRLVEAGVKHIDRLDGSRKADRVRMIKRFAPHYNRVSEEERAHLAPLRVLVSTDVLSEGVNLQDAALVVNYDLHWNPVRLMQRVGRVDRRLDPAVERAIASERQNGQIRGKVQVRNFLPPNELDHLLRLFRRVSTKVWMISKTLGIPGGKLLTEEDMLDEVKVFQAFKDEFYGEISPTERLRLEYQELCQRDAGLDERLERIPVGASSAKEGAEPALFLCQIRPALIREEGPDGKEVERWSLEDGVPFWSLHPPVGEPEAAIERIADAARSASTTPRVAFSNRDELRVQLRSAEAGLNKEFTKVVNLPLDAPPPRLVCWMEIR